MKGRYVFLISVAVGAALSFAIAPVQRLAACGTIGPDQNGWNPGVYDDFCDSPGECADCAAHICGGSANWNVIGLQKYSYTTYESGVKRDRTFYSHQFRCYPTDNPTRVRCEAEGGTWVGGERELCVWQDGSAAPECDAAECPMPDASVTQ